MAQWSHKDRTLHAKLVYYGPAFGGKTTNLEALHHITDPRGHQRLLSVKTSDDRTLFFDLLPLELGNILGYQVAIKLYTVPGQVRYETTRQVVLNGADAVVFVADSSPQRREKNVWSLQNLRMNLRSGRRDPARVPLVFQFNKQDLADAAPPDQVASWLGVDADRGHPAVAVDGRGVLETFMTASRLMLESLVAGAEATTRRRIDLDALRAQIERAFAPYLAREQRRKTEGAAAAAMTTTSIVTERDDLVAASVESGLRLGERLSAEVARAGRLDRQAEAFRRLSESLRSVGATFDRGRIVTAALSTAAEVLGAPAVSLIYKPAPGRTAAEATSGRAEDPLIASGAGGRGLLEQMMASSGACVVEDLHGEIVQPCDALEDLRAAAAVPVEPAGARTLVAYALRPDGAFDQHDVRFLATVAGHLAVGLEKARLHRDLAGHRDRLEETVAARTEELRAAYDNLRSLDQMKDSFLSNLSHEMKSPLTAILSSAYALRDYETSADQRVELTSSIVRAGETLQRALEDLFRLVHLESGDTPPDLRDTDPRAVVRNAVELAGRSDVRWRVETGLDGLRIDATRVGRALANLIDNACKFSPEGAPVEVVVESTGSTQGGGSEDVRLVVLDRGPGVRPEDRERIFAPFEQGGDVLRSKPAGIGIGLYEARTIAESHGGALEHVPREGGGSEFRLTLPLQPATTVCEETALV